MTEARKAYENFLQTSQTIKVHNEKYERGVASFKQSPNMFADISKEERERLAKGFRPAPAGVQGRQITIISRGMFPPGPSFVDWRLKGAITPVKDQGFFCNACWAFSAIAGLEAHWFIKYNKSITFSEQNLIDCNRHNFTGNWGCLGGSQSSAYEYIRQNGIMSEDNYPYADNIPHDDIFPCNFQSNNSVGKIKGYYRLRPRNEIILRDTIAALGPCAFGFNGAIESFMYYKEGIYDDDKCHKGLTHSALIVGYGTQKLENGTLTDYWLCKNSWSADWGEQGYFKIVR